MPSPLELHGHPFSFCSSNFPLHITPTDSGDINGRGGDHIACIGLFRKIYDFPNPTLAIFIRGLGFKIYRIKLESKVAERPLFYRKYTTKGPNRGQEVTFSRHIWVRTKVVCVAQ